MLWWWRQIITLTAKYVSIKVVHRIKRDLVDHVALLVFDKLCDYLDNNARCQFSLPELVSLVNNLSEHKESFTGQNLNS